MSNSVIFDSNIGDGKKMNEVRNHLGMNFYYSSGSMFYLIIRVARYNPLPNTKETWSLAQWLSGRQFGMEQIE
jgi:hypothetical protein